VLQAAEDELRRIEVLMSTWIETSELSALNQAGAGESFPLSADSLTVLETARELYEPTAGAFDITCGPLIELWRRAGRIDREPTDGEIEAVRASSTWADLELLIDGVRKLSPTAMVDVDGIAKGYAIDRAIAVLEAAGALGGMVEVGGDLRVFGESPREGGWAVGILDPSSKRVLGVLTIDEGAVCTSGDYARYLEIGGRRYSQLIDPRSGRPVEATSSVTVVAPDAVTADAWATGLSVLGGAGLESLPLEEGLEALVILSGSSRESLMTAGFRELLVDGELLDLSALQPRVEDS